MQRFALFVAFLILNSKFASRIETDDDNRIGDRTNGATTTWRCTVKRTAVIKRIIIDIDITAIADSINLERERRCKCTQRLAVASIVRYLIC